MLPKGFMFVLLGALSYFVFVYSQDEADLKNYGNASDILHVLTDMERSVAKALKSIYSKDNKLQKNKIEALIAQYTNFLKYVTVENDTVLMKPLLEAYSKLEKNFTKNALDNAMYKNLTESDDNVEKYIQMLEKEKFENT